MSVRGRGEHVRPWLALGSSHVCLCGAREMVAEWRGKGKTEDLVTQSRFVAMSRAFLCMLSSGTLHSAPQLLWIIEAVGESL